MGKFTVVYDGTFDGFLTAIFEIYAFKLDVFALSAASTTQDSFFAENFSVSTDKTKADRVWESLKKNTSKTLCYKIYSAFLAEQAGMELVLLRVIQRAFQSHQKITSDFSDPDVLRITQVAKMVGREKHRMEAFIRFKLTKNGIYFANCEPDFNVLPLIKAHFERRYADQQWLIYDLKRHYGLFYNLQNVEVVAFIFDGEFNPTKTDDRFFDSEELGFQKLWKDYFASTNIKARKNMRLHVQHVPKRYWKYLSEKQPNL